MKSKYGKRLLALLVSASLLAGCTGNPVSQNNFDTNKQGYEKIEKESEDEREAYHLRDKDSLYANDDETSVVTMYLTVSKGNSAENTDHTWEEINTYSVYDYDDMGVERYQVNGLLQVGDENGPIEGEVGYGEEVPNATVNVRGQTSSRNQQKNYKIELKKNKGMWRGQRTINLNKHQTEGIRFRNKMMYDLMKQIPQIMSLRTQFVHLYVKDETTGEDEKFEDYGLYTQVEQLNKTGLKNHGLDSNGQLYKINFFEFFRYEDTIKLETDAEFNKKEFEKLLEIKGNTDHSKLIQMLEAVNDYSISTDTLLDTYFDSENIAYWMAFMILTGNRDTQNRNVYLYSPQNLEKWYLIPWDNDGGFMKTERAIKEYVDGGNWECGVSNYWGNMLFRRCLKSEKFRNELDGAIKELKKFLTEERLNQMVESYKSVVKPYVFRMPDAVNEGLTSEEYDQISTAFVDEIEENFQLYCESLEKPMPFFIGIPVNEDGRLQMNWDIAYDFDAEDITYTVELAKDYLFQDVIFEKENLQLPEMVMELPEPGQYFVRIKAKNTSGKEQYAFDYYVTDSGKNYGMKCFYIQNDGTIKEDIYVE